MLTAAPKATGQETKVLKNFEMLHAAIVEKLIFATGTEVEK